MTFVKQSMMPLINREQYPGNTLENLKHSITYLRDVWPVDVMIWRNLWLAKWDHKNMGQAGISKFQAHEQNWIGVRHCWFNLQCSIMWLAVHLTILWSTFVSDMLPCGLIGAGSTGGSGCFLCWSLGYQGTGICLHYTLVGCPAPTFSSGVGIDVRITLTM